MIALLNLFGFRYLARHENLLFQNHIMLFEQAIEAFSTLLGPSDRIDYQMGTAYIESEDPSRLADFCANVRGSLLSKAVYVKGVLGPGTLEAQSMGDKVRGHRWGRLAAELAAEYERLKGIGIVVKQQGDQPLLPTSLTASTVFLDRAAQAEANDFLDLKIPEQYLTHSTVQQLFSDCFRFPARSRHAGRYFITLVITLLRSVDWSKLSREPYNKDPDPDSPVARHVFDILTDRESSAPKFLGLEGFQYVYYALLDESAHFESADLRQSFAYFIAKRKSLARLIDTIPATLLSTEMRAQIEHLLLS
jgi:hypothetical protein